MRGVKVRYHTKPSSWRAEPLRCLAVVTRSGSRGGDGEFHMYLDVIWDEAVRWIAETRRIPLTQAFSARFWSAVEREFITLFTVTDAHERLHLLIYRDETAKVPRRWIVSVHHRVL